jgi:hypothetical protein
MSGGGRKGLAVALLAIVLGTAGMSQANSSHETAPFSFAASASATADGNDMVIRVEPHPARPAGATGPFDLYVVQLTSWESARFLTPAGLWSEAPVAMRQNLLASRMAPLRLQWSESQLGTMHLLVLATKASSDPRLRGNWLFQPKLRLVRLKARLSPEQRGHAIFVIGSLGFVTLVAAAAVLGFPRGWGRRWPSPPPGDDGG